MFGDKVIKSGGNMRSNMRVNKFLSTSGVASRRKSEELISQGRVKINGEVVVNLGTMVDIDNDIVEVDGKKIEIKEIQKVYILLNKPAGYITTAKEQFGRKSVMDLVSDIKERVYPVGRLDYETSGLLLLTNDGDLTYALTHPKHEFEKIYIASVRGKLLEKGINDFKNGLEIENYTTSKAKLKVLKYDSDKNYSVCKVGIHEGHNRQIRKMFDKIGNPVMNLKRVQLGKIRLDDLEIGKYRHLEVSEIEYLKKFCR